MDNEKSYYIRHFDSATKSKDQASNEHVPSHMAEISFGYDVIVKTYMNIMNPICYQLGYRKFIESFYWTHFFNSILSKSKRKYIFAHLF